MAARLGLFLIFTIVSTSLNLEAIHELIVWNVGQGQWVTIQDTQGCWHLDMGGEFAPWSEIMRHCRLLKNRVSLSHWDIDHIGFLGKARSRLPNLCLLNSPLGRSSPHKEAMVGSVSKCQEPSPFQQWSDPSGKTANDKSWVVNWQGVLAPGDSTRGEEKFWIHHLGGLRDVRILVLGHHGSRTSTSLALLRALPRLAVAISSARQRRYGHPHPEVVRELNEMHIPLLRTEEWGTIHILL